jgi:Ala-tRNA(Pro) deacylase
MDLFSFLDEHGVAYERFDHPPVYTVEDVHRLTPDLPGAKTKNLFLKDQKGKRHLLVIVPDEKRVNLKAMAAGVDARRVSFASAQRLEKHLGITPGAVSLLAVFNDRNVHAVEVFIDAALWARSAFQFHPLVNTATLVVPKAGIETFLAATGHRPRILEVPAQTG